jgi:hypothetical protein
MDDCAGIFEEIQGLKKNKKIFLCVSEIRERLTAFWGEQQAVVTLVAAACNFFRGLRFGKNSGSRCR